MKLNPYRMIWSLSRLKHKISKRKRNNRYIYIYLKKIILNDLNPYYIWFISLLSSTRPSSSTKQRNKRYKSSNKIYLTTRAATLLARDRTKHQYPTIIPETLIRYPCARDRISASSPQGTRYIPRRRIESGRKCRERAIADPEGPVARTGAERTCSPRS